MYQKTLFMLFFMATSSAVAADKPANPGKQSPYDLYLTASEAYAMKESLGNRVLFLDIRTPSEILFLGMPDNADANVPFSTIDFTLWDDGKKAFKSRSNPDFPRQVRMRARSQQLDLNAPVILICRSGKRSARAAKLLKLHGFGKVYTVIDGFEGDKVKKGPNKGKRTVNGWKNADLPWSYRLQREKVTISRASP